MYLIILGCKGLKVFLVNNLLGLLFLPWILANLGDQVDPMAMEDISVFKKRHWISPSIHRLAYNH